jgi:class 3 adenylate cyclase
LCHRIQTTLNAQANGLRLRIGMYQGEVVPEGDDLFGDGVIVAARLERWRITAAS